MGLRSGFSSAASSAAQAASAAATAVTQEQTVRRQQVNQLIAQVNQVIKSGKSYDAKDVSHRMILENLTAQFDSTFRDKKQRQSQSLKSYGVVFGIASIWFCSLSSGAGAAMLWYLADSSYANNYFGDKREIEYDQNYLKNAMVSVFKWAAKNGPEITADPLILAMLTAVTPYEQRKGDQDELYPDAFRDRDAHSKLSDAYKNLMRGEYHNHIFLQPNLSSFWGVSRDEKVNDVAIPAAVMPLDIQTQVSTDWMRVFNGCRRVVKPFYTEEMVADEKAAPGMKKS